MQAGEKTAQNFRLEVTNPGGDSSPPVKDNAIYHLAAALLLDAGHATNALPQRARANVNCRIFPGVTPETARARLEEPWPIRPSR